MKLATPAMAFVARVKQQLWRSFDVPRAAAEKKVVARGKNHPTDSRLEVATRKATKRAGGADKEGSLRQ